MKRSVLIGNYGVGNLGDEALKEYFLRTFPSREWYVLSAHPRINEYHRLPCGIRSFFSMRWWKTVKIFWMCDEIVFGGGSLFTDSESVYACILWWMHAFVGKMFRKPIHLAFQGIGPFRTLLGKWCAIWVLRRATTISVRDVCSEERIKTYNLNTKVVLSFDPIYKEILPKKGERSQNVFTIIPRKNSPKEFWDRAQEFAQSRAWDDIRIVCLQKQHCAFRNATVNVVQSLSQLHEKVGESFFIFTQRYHGALAALVLDVPFSILPQQKGDKLEALMREQGVHREEILARIQKGEEMLSGVDS